MFVRKKLWLSLSAALVTGSALGAVDALAAEEAAQNQHMGHAKASAAAPGESGEGGEGVGVQALESDAAYLTQLALIRGHLGVGLDLYRAGAADAAASHMKHPEDELYIDLMPGMKARGAAGFGEEMASLAKVVEGHGSIAEADAAYQTLLLAVGEAEAAAGKPQAQALGEIILNLVKTAAEEYDIAVENALVVNAHEYQDALGFLKVAQALTSQLAEVSQNTVAVEEISGQLRALASAWPGVVPPEKVDIAPSRLYGAAARVELAVLSL